MASAKHWALYAHTYRLNQPNQHRLAGARIGHVGVHLRWHMPNGWRAKVYVGRFSLEFEVGLRNNDPRIEQWLDVVWPERDTEIAAAMAEMKGRRDGPER